MCVSAIGRRATPLHEAAAEFGRADVVAALLTHGADVHARDNDGCGGRPGRSDAPTRMRVCARAHAHTCVCVCVCTCARTRARAHAHAHTRRCTGERASAHTAGRDTCVDFVFEACMVMFHSLRCLCASTCAYAHERMQSKACVRAHSYTRAHLGTRRNTDFTLRCTHRHRRTHTRTHKHPHTCQMLRLGARAHARLYERTRTHMSRSDARARTQTHARARTDYSYSLTYACVYAFMRTPTQIAVCMYW